MCKKLLILFVAIIGLNISCYSEDPVDIDLTNASQIIELSERESFNPADEYHLLHDIDMAGYTFQQPIGYTNPFKGTFYGNGHKISNITFVSTNDYIGFFSKNEGTITDLNVENARIIGHDYVGGLVGHNVGYNKGHIINCEFSGTVSGNDYVGGLVGFNDDGTIELSATSGEVTGHDWVGGLVGKAYAPSHVMQVQKSSSACSVTGHYFVGGLIGFYIGSDIENCYYRGHYKCEVDEWTSVNGEYSVGGLMGCFGSCIAQTYKIKNCYSIGKLTGDRWCGGLVGQMSGYVEECFTRCEMECPTDSENANGNFIGFVTEYLSFNLKYSYYENTNNSLLEVGDPEYNFFHLIELELSQMHNQNSYTNWDFTNIWSINELYNDHYPYLRLLPIPKDLEEDWRPYDRDEDQYIDITNICELRWVDQNPQCWTWNFEFDFPDDVLDCQGKTSTWNKPPVGTAKGFLPIGRYTEPNVCLNFKGNFNGNNDTIKNLTITNGTHAIGFLGCVNKPSSPRTNANQVIQNINLDNLSITCPESDICYVGGLIGHFWEGDNNQTFELNKILNCKITNSSIICKTYQSDPEDHFLYIGGLIGGADNGATIGGCSVENTSITGNGAIGGFAGYTKVTLIDKCYAIDYNLSKDIEDPSGPSILCAVADSAIGGFIGICDGYVGLCYENPNERKCTIQRCFTNYQISNTLNTPADVNLGNKIGGFIGSLAPYYARWEGYSDLKCYKKPIDIINCYSKGTINTTNGQYIGGFIGYVNKGCTGPTESHISKSYSASTITGGYFKGGFIGSVCIINQIVETPHQIKCFWDYTKAPLDDVLGVDAEGKVTADMKLLLTYSDGSYTEPQWNFGNWPYPNGVGIWGILSNGLNEGYPFLAENPARRKISILNSNFLSDLEIVVSPNPVINLSTLEINIQKEDLIELSLFNILGNKISTIFSGKALGGSNYYNLDASQLNSGTYYIVLRTSSGIASKTIVISK